MMTDKTFTVTMSEGGNGFTMHLSTGDATIPDTQDAYVVSTGCGSGKSRSCEDLIGKNYDKGILYCVDTKVELDKMYNKILVKLPTWGLTIDDVMIISSDPKRRDPLKEYMDNPEVIMTKKILLITHSRFFLDFINYFLIYNPKKEVKPFTGDFVELMKRDDLRQYVLFDETPTFINPFLSIPRSMLAAFSEDDGKGGYSFVGEASMVKRYNDFIVGSSDNPFGDQQYKLNQIKKDVGLGLIAKNYDKWLATNAKEYDVTYYPVQLCQDVVKTHIVFLEGAGNILFDTVHRFNLIDVADKYNSTVRFEPFKFGLQRREKQREVSKLLAFEKWLHEKLKTNQTNGEKSLVVVWMDYATNGNKSQKIVDFQKYIETSLKRAKHLDPDYYSVIYFGSDKSKSTNEFRDYKHIFLCGTWGVASGDVAKFNAQFGASLTVQRKQLWSYVQLITRIGIREHAGSDYKVWYSDDYSKRFIVQLSQYFNNNTLDRRKVYTERCPDWLADRVEFKVLHKNYKIGLLKLTDWSGTILDNLELRTPFTVHISLDEIAKLFPDREKKRGKYKSLIDALATLGMELIID